MPDPTNAELVAAYSEQTDRLRELIDQIHAWTAGVAAGGPNGDGKYPLPYLDTGGEQLVPCPARMAFDAAQLGIVTILNQSAATLDASHAGKLVRIINPNTTALTIANTVPAGWSCVVTREGSGAVTFAIGSGGTLRQDQSFDRMRAQWSIAPLFCTSRVGGVSNVLLGGSLTA